MAADIRWMGTQWVAWCFPLSSAVHTKMYMYLYGRICMYMYMYIAPHILSASYASKRLLGSLATRTSSTCIYMYTLSLCNDAAWNWSV